MSTVRKFGIVNFLLWVFCRFFPTSWLVSKNVLCLKTRENPLLPISHPSFIKTVSTTCWSKAIIFTGYTQLRRYIMCRVEKRQKSQRVYYCPPSSSFPLDVYQRRGNKKRDPNVNLKMHKKRGWKKKSLCE